MPRRRRADGNGAAGGLGRVGTGAGLHISRPSPPVVLYRAQNQAVRHSLRRVRHGQDAAGRDVCGSDDGPSTPPAVPAYSRAAGLERLDGPVRLPQHPGEPLRFHAVSGHRPRRRPAGEPAAGVFCLPGRDEPGPRSSIIWRIICRRWSRAPTAFPCMRTCRIWSCRPICLSPARSMWTKRRTVFRARCWTGRTRWILTKRRNWRGSSIGKGQARLDEDLGMSARQRQALFLSARAANVGRARERLSQIDAAFPERALAALQAVNDLLYAHRLHFAYRVRDDVLMFLANSFDAETGQGLLLPDVAENFHAGAGLANPAESPAEAAWPERDAGPAAGPASILGRGRAD